MRSPIIVHMNAVRLLEELRRPPVFGNKEVTGILGCDKRYADLALKRLHDRNAIKRVDFGKYTTCNLAQTIATHLVGPSYITGWYALRIHDLTEQLPQLIDVMITKKKNKKTIDFKREKIRFITVDKKHLFGFYSVPSEQHTMDIASPEKAIIDCLYYDLAPLSTVIRAIEMGKGRISSKRVVKMCLRLKNKRFLKKVGIVFDSSGIDLYERFKQDMDYNPVPMDDRLCGLLDSTRFQKWNIRCQ